MINLDFFKKQIQVMDVKSEEFFDLYSFICDKYFAFENPDDFQQAAMVLRMYIDKATGNYEEQLISIVKMVEQIMSMDREGTKACMGTVGFKDKEYHFTITTDKKHLEQMSEIMGEVVKGNFKVKEKKK